MDQFKSVIPNQLTLIWAVIPIIQNCVHIVFSLHIQTADKKIHKTCSIESLIYNLHSSFIALWTDILFTKLDCHLTMICQS